MKAPKPSRSDARHEAAHAVVSVRSGLPLASTDIRRGRPIEQPDRFAPSPLKYVSVGYTTLEPGTVEQWRDALPDPSAADLLTRFAAQAAAGVVAEMERGAQPTDPTCRDDLQQLVQIAGVLGLGESNADEPVRAFMAEAISRASELLCLDNRVGWESVTTALLRRSHLTGEDVRAIIGGRS